MIDLLDISAQSEGCGTEKKYRLADYFNRWWDEYTKHPTEHITPEQYKAANAIRVCRTAALGIDTYACPECGEVRESTIAARTVSAPRADGVTRSNGLHA